PRQGARGKPLHPGLEKLLAQVGRGIDQHSGDAGPVPPLNQKRGAPAAIFGIARIAVAARRPRIVKLAVMVPCAQAYAERLSVPASAPCGGTLRNRRKKFSLVCRAIISSETPRTSARTLA